jgi:hypothetical protein
MDESQGEARKRREFQISSVFDIKLSYARRGRSR